jgi:hypothetical protein
MLHFHLLKFSQAFNFNGVYLPKGNHTNLHYQGYKLCRVNDHLQRYFPVPKTRSLVHAREPVS